MNQTQREVINLISSLISDSAHRCASEQYDPRHDADQMDQYIKERKDEVRTLRRIREELEDLFSGVV